MNDIRNTVEIHFIRAYFQRRSQDKLNVVIISGLKTKKNLKTF